MTNSPSKLIDVIKKSIVSIDKTFISIHPLPKTLIRDYRNDHDFEIYKKLFMKRPFLGQCRQKSQWIKSKYFTFKWRQIEFSITEARFKNNDRDHEALFTIQNIPKNLIHPTFAFDSEIIISLDGHFQIESWVYDGAFFCSLALIAPFVHVLKHNLLRTIITDIERWINIGKTSKSFNEREGFDCITEKKGRETFNMILSSDLGIKLDNQDF